MKVAITGGHLSPAVAVIEELKESKAKIVFFGRKYAFENDKSPSLEYLTIKKLNIPFVEVTTGKAKRQLTLGALSSFFKVPYSLRDTYKKLKFENPDILLSFGGYISVPVALSAFLLRIPIVIHEQTQKAGAGNKFVSRFANKVCITFESSRKFFPKNKTVLTGNPIRREVFEILHKIRVPDSKKIIYITGGSTGAHRINMLVKEALAGLLNLGTIIHQTGDTSLTGDYTILQEERKKLPDSLHDNYIIKKYIETEELGWIYKNADVIISRSGINTVLELMATNSVALLIPLEVGQKDEQLDNAKLYSKTTLGIYRHQDDLTPASLVSEVEKLIKETKERKSKSITPFLPTNAARQVADILISIHEEKRRKNS